MPIRAKSSRDSRVVGPFKGTHVVKDVALFFEKYIVLPPASILVIAAWTTAAWLAEVWDRFPHLAATSPEKRCGKTRLLQLLELVVPKAYNMANISPAAVYRLVKKEQPTLLLDEAQSIVRRGSEASEIIRELFNAGIDRNSKVIRCGGKQFDEIHEFPIYSPKVIALIGELDGVLADRCLPIRMERKTASDPVMPFRLREGRPEGKAIHGKLEQWAEDNSERVAKVYDKLQPFPIENDRMAELLMPLQAVLTVIDPGCLPALEQYAIEIDKAERDRLSPGVILLNACRDIFQKRKALFLSTEMLLGELANRPEEPWSNWNRGEAITAEGLARLLKPFTIQPQRTQKKFLGNVLTSRGYFANDFKDSWERYCVPENNPTTRLPRLPAASANNLPAGR